MLSGKLLSMVWRNLVPLSSGWSGPRPCSCETFITIYQSA